MGKIGLKRIFRYNAVILASAMLIFVGIAVFTLYHVNRNNIDRQVGQAARSIAAAVDRNILNVSRFSAQVFLDEEFQKATQQLNDIDSQPHYETIQRVFSSMSLFDSFIADMCFWPLGESGGISYDTCIIQGSSTFQILHNMERFSAVLADPENSRGRLVCVPVPTWDDDTRYLAFTRVVLGSLPDNYLQPIGLGAAIVSTKQLFDAVSTITLTSASAGIADTDGGFVYAGSLPQADSVFSLKGTLISQRLDNFGWRAVGLYTPSTVFKSFRPTMFLLIAVTVVILVLFFCSMWLVTYVNTKQYYSFIHTFSQIEQGNQDAKMPYVGDREIDRVAARFNAMMDAINALNRDVMAAEVDALQLKLEKNEYLLKYLNSQINKHFLFNTFGLIRALVNTGEAKKAAQCVDCICDVMRYTLTSDDVVPLREELNSIRAYVRIMEMRRPDVSVKFEVPDDCLDAAIPKFVLQPIVENCYAHGFYRRGGHIAIRAARDANQLTVTVDDDGQGIAADKLKAIQTELKEGVFTDGVTGIALQNIQRRIRIVDSVQSSLTVDSEQGKWCRTTVVIQGKLGR